MGILCACIIWNLNIRDKKGLTVRQWLGVDAAGSFLAGCGILFRTVALMDYEPASRFEDLMNLYVFLLYLLPVCLLLGLTALLLWGAMGEQGGKPSRVLMFFGAVPQILVGVLHFGMMRGSTDILLNGLAVLVLGAGVAGAWAAVFGKWKKN